VIGRAALLGISAAVVALDQASKAVVDRFFELHESRPLIDGLLHLTYVRNRGAAFGILNDAALPYQSAIFAAVSLLALGAIAFYAWRLPASATAPRLGLALIMGGAVGNLVDRVRLGYVIDFVDAFWGRHHWPAFNVADSCISIGVVLLVVDMLRTPQPAGASPGEASASPGGGR
jgi:signal peptidase II